MGEIQTVPPDCSTLVFYQIAIPNYSSEISKFYKQECVSPKLNIIVQDHTAGKWWKRDSKSGWSNLVLIPLHHTAFLRKRWCFNCFQWTVKDKAFVHFACTSILSFIFAHLPTLTWVTVYFKYIIWLVQKKQAKCTYDVEHQYWHYVRNYLQLRFMIPTDFSFSVIC